MIKEKKRLLTEEKIDWTVAILLIIGFILTLIPLFIMAKYDHPCADDYTNGLYAHRAWLETGSVFEAVKAAAKKVSELYFKWQGTYSSILLMTLQPAVFGEEYYAVTPFIMIIILSISILYLLKVIMCDYLNTARQHYLITSSLLLIVSFQLMISPVEGIYWFNGSVHYVFMHACMLLLLGMFLKYIKDKKLPFMIAACILAIIVGGGNYITALTTILSLFIIGAFLVVYQKKEYLPLGILMFFSIGSLVVSGIAPGNGVRQENFEQPSVMQAIIKSFVDAVKFIGERTEVFYLVVLIFLIPFIWKVVSRKEMRFRFPVIIPIASFCLVSAMFAPTEYTMGLDYVGRTGNVIQLMIQLLGILNEIYLLGYLAQKHRERNYEWINKLEQFSVKGTVGFAALMAVMALTTVAVTKDNVTYTSISAVHSLRSGEAAAYDAEVRERIYLLENSEEKKLELNYIIVKPYLLFFDDITDNKKDWRNKSVAKFYGKKSVVAVN